MAANLACALLNGKKRSKKVWHHYVVCMCGVCVCGVFFTLSNDWASTMIHIISNKRDIANLGLGLLGRKISEEHLLTKKAKDVLSLHPMFPPTKRFDISPLCGILRRSRCVRSGSRDVSDLHRRIVVIGGIGLRGVPKKRE